MRLFFTFFSFFSFFFTFPVVPVVSRWRGDYGGRRQLWFPANYVVDVPGSPVRELDKAVSSVSRGLVLISLQPRQ